MSIPHANSVRLPQIASDATPYARQYHIALNDQFGDDHERIGAIERTLNMTPRREKSGFVTSPLSVKGDLWTFSTLDIKLAVGTNGQYLRANSAAATGLAWTTIPTTDISGFDEGAQDAVGAMVDATLVYVDATPLLTRGAITGDVSVPQASNTSTLATVNSNVGTFGSATQVAQVTVNGKGLTTAAANVTVTPAVGSITGLGTGVGTALGVNVGSAGAFVTFNGAGGTPSSMVGTNITGTASGLTAGNVTTNANLTGDVTSVGNATTIGATKVTSAMLNSDVYSTAHSWGGQQTFTAPVLGTPASGVATNLTGTASGLTAGTVTTNANLTGPITSSGNATSIASQTGTGTKFVVDTGPTVSSPTFTGTVTAAAATFSGQVAVGATTSLSGKFIVRDSASAAAVFVDLQNFAAVATGNEVRLRFMTYNSFAGNETLAPYIASIITNGATGANDLNLGIWDGTNVLEAMRITSAINTKIGGTAARGTTEGTNQLVLFNGTAPAGTLTNGASFYAASGEMRVMDSAGNSTLLSPHDRETNEWIFDSTDTKTGKRLRIDVERILRFIDQKYGLGAVLDEMQ